MQCEIKELTNPIQLDNGAVIWFAMEFLDVPKPYDLPPVYVAVDKERNRFFFAFHIGRRNFTSIPFWSVPEGFREFCIEEFSKFCKQNGREIFPDENRLLGSGVGW